MNQIKNYNANNEIRRGLIWQGIMQKFILTIEG